MIRHFFLDKTNTIIENSYLNYGLNPILSIGYGNGLSRGLIYFNIDDIKELITDKTFTNLDKLTFTLKMTNCFSLNGVPYEQKLIRGVKNYAERACSCDLILFKLPCSFDEGRGFDYIDDFWTHDVKSISKEGSTWYTSKTMIPWSETFIPNYDNKKSEGGIYSKELLNEEYLKYKNKEESIIISEQHFDFGNENLSMDITNYVLDCVKSGVNNGLCLAFSPFYESKNREKMQCLDFFTDHTNTFFHPYIEAEYKEYISDNRNNFIKTKDNKLYLYVFEDGELINLDKLPICTIDDCEYEVKQASKGIYYAEILAKNTKLIEDYIYYDRWSEIVLNGAIQDDVEMEFYVHPKQHKFSINNNSSVKTNILPLIYGINDSEDLTQNEIREINIDFIEKYTSNVKKTPTKAEYRLYVKDGENEINIINYQPIEIANSNNFFLLHTMDLIPNKYFIDIKVNIGREQLIFKEILNFRIVNNVTERYQ